MLVPFGIALGLVLAEALLQIAAWGVQRATGDALQASWLGGRLRVVCVGDSNTYGVYVGRERAYPQRVEALWNERGIDPGLEVLNLGVPGTNSSRLIRDLPDFLDSLTPELVLIMVGVNDYWTAPFEIEAGSESLLHRLKRLSKLYRFYRIARRGWEMPDVEMTWDPEADLEKGERSRLRLGDQEFDASWAKAPPDFVYDREKLRRNLDLLVEMTRRSGARPYLLTYPARNRPYAYANPVIRAVADATGTPLIDLTGAFVRRCPDARCAELLYSDQHPRAAGYRLVAETVVDRISGELAQRPPP